MVNIRIVTDSTADIPAEIRESLGIEMVPLKVHFGNETFLDSVTIQSEQFYERLKNAAQLPTTSQPSPVDFLETFKRLTEEENAQVICLTLASALSGTYQSALLAKSMLEDKGDITVIDSRTASYAIGLIAVAAAEAARNGKSKDEIVEMIHTIRENTGLYFLVDTLDYLHKGGRIGKAAALFGSLLNIKPILSIDGDGGVMSVDKVRGYKKAVGRIIELLKNQSQLRGPVQVYIAHAEAQQAAEEVASQMGEHFEIVSVTYTWIGPVIGTHAGPGTIGIFMVPA